MKTSLNSKSIVLMIVITIGLILTILVSVASQVFGLDAKYVGMINALLLMIVLVFLALIIGFIKNESLQRFEIFFCVLALLLTGFVSVDSTFKVFNEVGEKQCTTLGSQLERAKYAIVPIETNTGRGTGFAVGDAGYVLTAHHVIEGAETIKANWVGAEQNLSVVQDSPEYDVALLKLDKPADNYLQLTSRYAVSDEVYAYGFPGNTFTGGQASLSAGIVSRVLTNDDMKLNEASTPEGLEVLQTDAALNPGNSGGPLISKCGVIGIISAKSDSQQLKDYGLVSEEGITFAISAKSAATRFNLPIQ